MKKTTFITACLLSLSLFAQAQTTGETQPIMVFVDSVGNIIADGSVLNRATVETDMLGRSFISSGLFAHNTTSEDVWVGFVTTIYQLPSGRFQHCFPNECVNTNSPLTFSKVDERKPNVHAGAVKAHATESLQSEWILEKGVTGEATVTYQFKIYELQSDGKSFNLVSTGPMVTVNYKYSESTNINVNTAEAQLQRVDFYDLAGRKTLRPTKGVYIRKAVYADGRVKTDKITFE